MALEDRDRLGAFTHDAPCPDCGHDHSYLPCGYPCLCEHATRPGID